MARLRLVVVAVLALALVGLPLPAPGAPRVPDAVSRIVDPAPGRAVRPSAARGAWLALGSRDLPINANLIALSFRTDARDPEAFERLLVEAAFRTGRGWTEWQRLEVDPEEGPDAVEKPASDRVFTAPIWVGTADAISLRVASSPGGPAVADLRLHLVNTKGDAEDPNLLERAVGAVSRLLRGRPAEAALATPGIIGRARWGADESWRECCPRYADTVHVAFVHHTAGTNSYSAAESAAIVRSIYRFHTRDRGWSDIGYNFLVDRYGQIFEGRAGGVTLPVVGAHVQGFNAGTTGIALMGSFDAASPPSAMVSALERLLAWKLDVHHVPPTGTVTLVSGGNERYPAGRAVTFDRISGHRDADATACPGSRGYAVLPAVRSAVAGMGLPKLYLPAVAGPVVRPDGDAFAETTTFTASFSGPVAWSVSVKDPTGSTTHRRFSGPGASLAVTWDGRREDGRLVPTGPLLYEIEATDGAGAPARPAAGVVWAVTDHPDGTLLRAGDRTVAVQDGRARPVLSRAARDSWYRPGEQVDTGPGEIDRLPSGPPLPPREGTLLATPDGARYVFSGGRLRRFASDEVFAALGYRDDAVLPMTVEEAADLPAGPPVVDAIRHPSGTPVRDGDGGLWVVGEAERRPVPTDAVRRSWFRDPEVVAATDADLALPAGAALDYREGTLFQTPDGGLWIYSDGVRLGMDPTLFQAMGYATAAALPLPAAEAMRIPARILGPVPTVGTPLAGPSSQPGRPVAGDWDGNGTVTPGDVRGNVWYLNNGFDVFEDARFAYGRASDRVVVGDWDGNGTFTPGVVRGNVWYLNNGFDGAGDVVFAYGRASDLKVAGDWDGDGRTTHGVVRGPTWYLANAPAGPADLEYRNRM
jgi:hypothetical protein